ncbi:Phr family secreted Rap phosphatase inhibitor [Bacillus multifaciens]|uniref:Phr family secreted Rap phosphatase inhibitor n=1 Tax=Bacillus multifaciens TaxID=3068506 RepID=UPI00274186C1|nr:Phr family secreted Rap phosphatase inhibitor [Bacillus sp. WLY-B-L8]MDP7980466.1 Phr family secreted Rap phosphatase inhibitor [Bacillus sp. WLY-B-L8]
MKNLGLTVMSLAAIGILSFGLSTIPGIQQTAQIDNINKLQSTHGEGWSPQRSDLAYSLGNTGGSPADNKGDGGGIVTQEGHADTPAPANNESDTPVQQA